MIRSVRTKLLLVVASIVVLALVFVGLYSSRVARSEFVRVEGVEREILQPREGQDAIAERLANHYRETGGWTGVGDLLAVLRPDGNEELALFDENGSFVASTFASEPRTELNLEPSGTVRVEQIGDEWENVMSVRGRSWRIVDAELGALGSLHLIPAGEPVDGEESRTRVFMEPLNRALVWGVVVIGLISLSAVYFIASAMLRPIEALRRAAERMATGDLAQTIDVERADELGELARSFNAMADGLRKLEALRRDMVNDIAHELRTPLTNVRCRLETIQDGLAEPDRETIDALHGEVLLLSRLINDLQELSLAAAGQLPIDPESLDLSAELHRAVAAIRSTSGDAPAIDVDVSAGMKVRADPQRLQQIVRNLLGNAVRHTGRDGSVRIEARGEGSFARVAVIDSGEGIAPEHLPLVFERFHRVDPSRSRGTGGAGLGLAIVRHFVEAHGGRVGVESRPAEGSHFWFTLPIA